MLSSKNFYLKKLSHKVLSWACGEAAGGVLRWSLSMVLKPSARACGRGYPAAWLSLLQQTTRSPERLLILLQSSGSPRSAARKHLNFF